MSLTYADIEAAATRIAPHTRPLTVTSPEDDTVLALELLQHTGSFKARGAANFIAAHLESASMPDSGVTIASGGNAGVACAWAAARHGIRATVFVPTTAPEVKVAKLRSLGAEVHQVGTQYAEALEASRAHATETGALLSHAYDHPLIAAGAGTLVPELLTRADVDTIIVSVGGGGLLAGVANAAAHHGKHVVAVEPENCRALNAALEAGHLVDVEVDSIAADSLGARRATSLALVEARKPHVTSVTVPDGAIVEARRSLWRTHRLATEHAAATALAALTTKAYVPSPGERVALIVCGANTDPSDLR